MDRRVYLIYFEGEPQERLFHFVDIDDYSQFALAEGALENFEILFRHLGEKEMFVLSDKGDRTLVSLRKNDLL